MAFTVASHLQQTQVGREHRIPQVRAPTTEGSREEEQEVAQARFTCAPCTSGDCVEQASPPRSVPSLSVLPHWRDRDFPQHAAEVLPQETTFHIQW